MNQKGYSWMEAILTITVLSIIFSTLLPIATQISFNLHKKKLSMHAAETLYQGAILYSFYGQHNGQRTVEGTAFHWSIKDAGICVNYTSREKEFVKCIEPD